MRNQGIPEFLGYATKRGSTQATGSRFRTIEIDNKFSMISNTGNNKNPCDDYVVLLHGIARTNRIMRKMEGYLTQQGYNVYNDDYRSRSNSIELLADQIHERIRENCHDESKPLHFVAHSLGAIITRLILAKFRPKQLGRVVLLGPPNNGSQLVDFAKRFKFFDRVYGPAGQQLGTKDELIRQLPAPDYDVGVIAGDRSVDLLFSWFLLSGANDGKLTVEETKLAGMKDHIILHATHTFMPSNANVLKQVVYFLENGKFFR